MNKKFFDLLIEYSLKSYENNDVPVAAFIVKDNHIIAKGYNTREIDQNILGHAEINAIVATQKKLNKWNLSGYDLYVTLVPCSMCMEVIKQSRIDNIYYLLDKPITKKEFYKTKLIKITEKDYEIRYKEILGDFFKNLREK